MAFNLRPQIASGLLTMSLAAPARTEIASDSRAGTKLWLMAADSIRNRPQPGAI